jgi:two-component system cell cycle sensor histidine kinase/response regulator CckA
MAELDETLLRRLEGIGDFIAEIAGGDFTARRAVSDARDEVDAVVVGLNMLAEDFAAERRRRELAEERLRDAVEGYESAPGMFCSVDLSTGVIVQCNRTMADGLGRSKADIVGQPLAALYRPASQALMRASLGALVADARLPAGDHELLRDDGRAVPTLLSGSVVRDADGVAVRARLIYRDVGEERRLEAQLVQAQKMDGIGRLAGGIAHDFNNLLTAIFGSGELLREHVKPEGLDDLEQMLGAAQRAAELTSHLLAFSRRTVVSPRSVDLNERLRRMDLLLRRTLGERIEIHTVTEPALWTVIIDPMRLEQVVLNLAVNARDAMPEGGRLTLETQNVVVDDAYARLHLGSAPGEHVMLAVSDDGVGMGPEVLARVFEPFFTTKEVGKGTGLGLAMVYGIVRQAGGSVAVYSEPGTGTTFKILLPRALSPSEPPPSEVVAVTRGGNETVLVVEDDARVRDLVCRTLRGAGYAVLEAVDGDGALALARSHGLVDLLLTDVVMPRLGGLELAAALTAEGLCARVLFVSGYTANAIAHRGVQGAGTAFLQKPFTPAGLLGCVRALLDQGRAVAP